MERLGGGEWLDQIQAGEFHKAADGGFDAVEAGGAVFATKKIFTAPVRGEVAETAGFVDAAGGGCERARGDVGSQNVNAVRRGGAKLLEQTHGDRPGLLAGGTGGAPDADRAGDRGNDMAAQEIEMNGFAQERGEVGCQGVEKGKQLFAGAVGGDVVVVLAEAGVVALTDLLAEAGLDQFLLAFSKIDAAGAVSEVDDVFDLAVGKSRSFGSGGGFKRAPPRRE